MTFFTFIFSIKASYIHWIYRMNQQSYNCNNNNNNSIHFFSMYDHRYMYCFNDPYIYLIDDNIIHEFDCTNVTNMKLKSDLFQGYDKQVIPLYTRNKITLLNGKFYFFESTGLYQVDIESKLVVKLLPANVFSYRFIETTYVTSTNKLRAVGFNNVEEAEYFFMEIDFDKEY